MAAACEATTTLPIGYTPGRADGDFGVFTKLGSPWRVDAILSLMESLPWFVLHGPWFWKGALVVLVGASLAFWWLRTKLSLRHRARRGLERLGEPESVEAATAGKPVTLSGILGVEGKPTTRFDDGAPAAATTASPFRQSAVLGALAVTRCAEGLTLDVGGQLVGVEGELEVLVGSRELYLGRKFKRLGGRVRAELVDTDSDTLTALSSNQAAFRSLATGDRVRLRGFLRRLPAPAAAESYRAPGDRWVLSAQPEVGSSEVAEHTVAAAYEDKPRLSFWTPSSLIRRALVHGLLWFGVLGAAGGISLLTFDDIYRGTEHYRDEEQGYCSQEPLPIEAVISTMLPFGHAGKLSGIAQVMEDWCTWDERRVKRVAGAWMDQGRCGRAALALVNHGELALGEEVALGCDDIRSSRDALEALFIVGRFDEASDLADAMLPEAENWLYIQWEVITAIHLLAGNRERAARAADERARQLGDFDPPTIDGRPEPTGRLQPEARSYRCLAYALSALDGDASSLTRLETLAGESRNSYCPLLLAEVENDPARMGDWFQRTDLPRRDWMAWLLAVAADTGAFPPDATRFEGRLYLQPTGMLEHFDSRLGFGGLEQATLTRIAELAEQESAQPLLRALLHAEAAGFYRQIGDLDSARQQAEAVVASLNLLGENSSMLALAQGRLAVLEIEAGDLESARERIRTLRELRAHVTDYRFGPWAPHVQVEVYLAYWQTGNVQPLVDAGFAPPMSSDFLFEATAAGEIYGDSFERRFSPRHRRGFRPDWIRHIQSGREQLGRALRWGRRSRSFRFVVREILRDHAWDLQAARALGDEEWAGEVEPVLERFRTVASRREYAVELAIAEWR